ncbi:MAG: hypothetical protein V3V61_07360 [Gammaproteobacteria bacterium]
MDTIYTIITVLAVLVASFSGAKYAHDYSSKRDVDKKVKNDIYSIHYLLFILNVQLNFLKDILNVLNKKNYPFLNHSKDDFLIEYKSLTFILDTNDQVTLLQEIHQGQYNYNIMSISLDKYNKYIQKIKKVNELPIEIIDGEICDLKLSTEQEDRLLKLKNQLLKYAKESSSIIERNMDDLKKLCIKKFPEKKFLYGRLKHPD